MSREKKSPDVDHNDYFFFFSLAYRMVKNSQLTSLFFKIKTNLFSEEDASYPLKNDRSNTKNARTSISFIEEREKRLEILEIYLS